MANVLRKEQCPSCMDTGQDNMAVYDDGSAYCFGCSTSQRRLNTTNTDVRRKSSALVETGIFKSLEARGISKRTCEFFNYQVGTYTGYIDNEHVVAEQVHIANYCNVFGEVVAQKLRTKNKKMVWRGEVSKACLYGQWKYPPTDKLFITIVEGEIDALSLVEVQGPQFPVVSVHTGAGGAKKALQQHLEYLQGFKYVILGFDNDEAGIKATKECVELFEPGKVKVIKWPEKDANEMLKAGRGSEIKNLLFTATEIRPDKIYTPLQILDRILEKPKVGVSWPWEELTSMTYGMREQQLILVGAAPGIGKTAFCKDLLLHIATKEKIPSGIFSFEQDSADLMRRLIGGMLKVPLHIPDNTWDRDAITKCAHELEGKVYVYDSYGGVKVEEIIPKIRYLAKAHGVKLFVIDHLTALAAKMDGDQVKGIEKAMELLASLRQELRCCIVLVSHLSRDKKAGSDMSNGWGSGRMPAPENFKGSGSIEAWADIMLGLSRNADSKIESERSLLTVQCLKDRLSGAKRGHTFMLRYNETTGCIENFSSI